MKRELHEPATSSTWNRASRSPRPEIVTTFSALTAVRCRGIPAYGAHTVWSVKLLLPKIRPEGILKLTRFALNASIRSNATSLVHPKITSPHESNSFSSGTDSAIRKSSHLYPIHNASLNVSTLLERKLTIVRDDATTAAGSDPEQKPETSKNFEGRFSNIRSVVFSTYERYRSN